MQLNVARPLLAVLSATTSVSLRAVLYNLLCVLGRRLPSASVDIEHLPRHLTSLAPMAVTSSVTPLGLDTRPFDQRRRTSGNIGAAAVSTSNSCLVRWIPITSLSQRRLLMGSHNPHINRITFQRRIRISLEQCTACGYSLNTGG